MITNLNNQVFNASAASGKAGNSAMTNMFKVLSTKISGAASDSSAINSTIKGKMRELDQSARYAQEGVAIVQTAQEGLAKIEDNLNRMKELVTMATDVNLTDEDRQAIQKEINGLNKNITKTAEGTKYKGYNLLTPDEGEETEETEKNAAVKAFLEAMGAVDFTAKGLGTDKIDVSTAESALKGLDIVNQAIKKVKEQQNEFKLYEQQLTNTFNSKVENETSPDYNAKFAADTLELLKYKMSNEPIISCLAVANQNPENVQNLLTDK